MRKHLLSYQNTLKLIKEVKKHECLWNPEFESHADRYHTTKAWAEVTAEMQKTLNLSDEMIKTKWKNLRLVFKRQAAKYHVTSENTYSGKWRYFDNLRFLLRAMNLKYDKSDAKSDSSDDKEVTESNIKTEPMPEFENADIDLVPNKMFKADEDYDMMFLKSLMPYLRQLEPMRKLVVRNKMQELLWKEIQNQNRNNGSRI